MTDKSKIAVLGAGAWGTALASIMVEKGHETTLWGRDRAICDAINSTHQNQNYLPGIALSKQIFATNDLKRSVSGATAILVVVPAQTISKIALELKAALAGENPDIILCAKGIDRVTGKLPAEIFAAEMPGAKLAALSGPSFASDVANHLPTAVTLGSMNMSNAEKLAEQLSDTAFRVYANDDLYGTELGGALKNVIAVAVGACRGMQLGASAEAALIARGFAELSRLAEKLGAKRQTLVGLSGLGDLVLTCSSPQSRNFSYGMNLGSGKDVDYLALAEGAFTAGIAKKIATDNNIECPIIEAVANLVDGTIKPQEAMQQLLARPLKQESN